MSVATLDQRIAALAQAKAQTDSQRGHLDQAEASQRANFDALDKTISRAPFDGLVTNVPVREGETVVVGIQNAEGSTLMTLADMSVITAEVKVDETDIVNIALGQSADVTVDALPGRVFKGHVTEVGDQALLRTTGIATSQSTTGTEEAKDFKVVVTLDQTPGNHLDELRPGLSTTARITTAQRPDALTIPIQALVQRDPAVEKTLLENDGKLPQTVSAATTAPAKQNSPRASISSSQPAESSVSPSFPSPPESPGPPTSKSSPASTQATRSSSAATRSCAPSKAEPSSSATPPP